MGAFCRNSIINSDHRIGQSGLLHDYVYTNLLYAIATFSKLRRLATLTHYYKSDKYIYLIVIQITYYLKNAFLIDCQKPCLFIRRI